MTHSILRIGAAGSLPRLRFRVYCSGVTDSRQNLPIPGTPALSQIGVSNLTARSNFTYSSSGAGAVLLLTTPTSVPSRLAKWPGGFGPEKPSVASLLPAPAPHPRRRYRAGACATEAFIFYSKPYSRNRGNIVALAPTAWRWRQKQYRGGWGTFVQNI